MGRYCLVKDCKGGKQSSSLFRVPTDTAIYEQWAKILHQNGEMVKSTRAYVCEKHFQSKDVNREIILYDSSGRELQRHSLQRPRLKKGAVPCIFPKTLKSLKNDNSGNKMKLSQQTKPSIPNTVLTKMSDVQNNNQNVLTGVLESTGHPQRQSNSLTNVVQYPSPIRSSATHLSGKDNLMTELQMNSIKEVMENDDNCIYNENTRNNLFDLLFKRKIVLQLPSISWAMSSCQTNERIITISEVSHSSIDQGSLFLKQILLTEDLQYTVFFHRKHLKLDRPSNVSSVTELQSLIEYVHSLRLCSGGFSVSVYGGISLRCAYKDVTNKWRHNNCLLKATVQRSCKYCVSLHDTVTRHFRRKLTRTQQKELFAIKKKSLTILRALQRKKRRAMFLEEQMKTLQEILSEVSHVKQQT